MYHQENHHNEGYSNNSNEQVTRTNNNSGYDNNRQNFNWGEPSSSNNSLNNAQTDEEEDEDDDDDEEDETCNVCEQNPCICNSFDPTILQQIPQLALLIQQQSTNNTSVEETKFICNICQEWFLSQEKLTIHLIINHSMIHCKYCRRIMSSNEHHHCDQNRSEQCNICGALFTNCNNNELIQHYTNIHNIYTCMLCNSTMQSSIELSNHLIKKHLSKLQGINHIINLINNWDFICLLCEKTFEKNEIYTHYVSHHKLNITNLIELIQKSRYSGNNTVPHHEGESCCNICFQSFTNQVPKLIHDVFCRDMAYCIHCNISLESITLEEHMINIHNNIIPCKICGESSTDQQHYINSHCVILCPCCDNLLPINSFENHLLSSHYCRMNQDTTIIKHNSTLISCNLCLTDDKFTTDNHDVINITNHLVQNHFISLNKLIYLLNNKGRNKIVPNINTNTTNWLNPISEEDILVPQVAMATGESSAESSGSDVEDEEIREPEDNGGPDDEEGEEEDDQTHEPDVDPNDIECVTDSSDDEEENEIQHQKTFICELCEGINDIIFNNPREVCNHFMQIHKMHWNCKNRIEQEIDYNCNSFKTINKPEFAKHKKELHSSEICIGKKCRFCPEMFIDLEARNEHQLQLHSDQLNEFYRCYICQVLMSTTAMIGRHEICNHLLDISNNSSGYRLKCRVCLLLFPSLTELRTHFRAIHPATMIYPCKYCGSHLKSRKTLRHHIKVVHCESRRKDCNICGKIMWSRRAYTIHYRMKHSKVSKVGFRCRICQKRFDTKEERKLHYTIDHEGESPYKCIDCGKGFSSKSGMYGHRQLHTGAGESKCSYCGKTFTRKDSYNEHLLIHNGPRHKCPHCPKEFVQRSNLIRHIRIHTGEKPYQCTYCDKRFSDKGACNSHIKVHTREETCTCPYCGQTFSKKQKLKYHIRKHTGEGLLECEICNKMFTNSFALKEHRVIHNRQTQVVCPQCGKGFNSEKYLQRHVAIVHEPNHQYVCTMCPKTFSQQARLKAHIMTHSGVKHIKCLLCDKSYSVRKSLRRHLYKKHNITPEHPQYKNCFHAMSLEEVENISDIKINTSTASTSAAISTPSTSNNTSINTPAGSSGTTSGRKRRRVEQIVQSLQHSALTQSESVITTNISPRVNKESRKKSKVKPRNRQQQPQPPQIDDINGFFIDLIETDDK